MSLIDRSATIGDTVVPRSLFGDDKIKAILREWESKSARGQELLDELKRARFDVDPPDNAAVRRAVKGLLLLADEFPEMGADLRLLTQVTSDGPSGFEEE